MLSDELLLPLDDQGTGGVVTCRWCAKPTAMTNNEWRCQERLCGGCMCRGNNYFIAKLAKALDENNEKLIAGVRAHFSNDLHWSEIVATAQGAS